MNTIQHYYNALTDKNRMLEVWVHSLCETHGKIMSIVDTLSTIEAHNIGIKRFSEELSNGLCDLQKEITEDYDISLYNLLFYLQENIPVEKIQLKIQGETHFKWMKWKLNPLNRELVIEACKIGDNHVPQSYSLGSVRIIPVSKDDLSQLSNEELRDFFTKEKCSPIIEQYIQNGKKNFSTNQRSLEIEKIINEIIVKRFIKGI